MKPGKAIKPPSQLTRLINAVLTKVRPYLEKGVEAFEARRQNRQLRTLERQAHRRDLSVTSSFLD
jgi:hypothetical protein